MADIFDMNVDGVGWHFTSHLIAVAALFIACFAIAGYITFRNDSIPGDAINDSDGFEHPKSIRRFIPILDSVKTDPGAFKDASKMLARNKPTSAADSQKILGYTTTPTKIPSSITIREETYAPNGNPFAPNGCTIISGNLKRNLELNPSADSFTAVGQKSIILFYNFTMSNGVSLKINVHTNDTIVKAGSEQFYTKEDKGILTRQVVPDNGLSYLVLTATGESTILNGSFIYFESFIENRIIAKSCVQTVNGKGSVQITDILPDVIKP